MAVFDVPLHVLFPGDSWIMEFPGTYTGEVYVKKSHHHDFFMQVITRYDVLTLDRRKIRWYLDHNTVRYDDKATLRPSSVTSWCLYRNLPHNIPILEAWAFKLPKMNTETFRVWIGDENVKDADLVEFSYWLTQYVTLLKARRSVKDAKGKEGGKIAQWASVLESKDGTETSSKR